MYVIIYVICFSFLFTHTQTRKFLNNKLTTVRHGNICNCRLVTKYVCLCVEFD